MYRDLDVPPDETKNLGRSYMVAGPLRLLLAGEASLPY